MIEQSVVDGLRKRYEWVHPLVFQRSVERAKTPGELYDILESLPDELPIVWDESRRRWIVTEDLMQAGEFEPLE